MDRDHRLTARIVTVTLNPAVDISAITPAVTPGHKMRTRDVQYDPGGGGVNVARVVHDMGGAARAVVLVGGATGLLYEELLGAHGVAFEAIAIRGRTRVSMNVRAMDSGEEYRFVPEGPEISEVEWRAVLGVLETVEADWIVGSGSLPRGVPDDFYARMARLAARRGQRFVLDTSGAPLKAALGQGIALAKPSQREFAALVGQALPDTAALEAAALAMVRAGAVEMLVVSLGQAGAMLATAGGIHRLAAPALHVRSAVGAGDSFVAGMTMSLARGEPAETAFAWGIAVGSAAVASEGTAHVDPALAADLFRRLSGP